jgi:hypothetical protein
VGEDCKSGLVSAITQQLDSVANLAREISKKSNIVMNKIRVILQVHFTKIAEQNKIQITKAFNCKFPCLAQVIDFDNFYF